MREKVAEAIASIFLGGSSRRQADKISRVIRGGITGDRNTAAQSQMFCAALLVKENEFQKRAVRLSSVSPKTQLSLSHGGVRTYRPHWG